MSAFAPETIFRLGQLPVTNTLINTLIVDGALIGFAFAVKRKMSIIPGLFQNAVEYLIETLYNLTESLAGDRTDTIFPYFATFFLFILVANYTGLIPGFNTFGFFHHGELTPIIRPTTTDLNTTFGLALVSLAATHILSIKILGIKEYIKRYISLNPVLLFVGILEIISEFTKVISLSFRLFGNIYAGEVLLGTISSIFAFLVPLPFLLLEVIVGFVQALVFAMLTLVFMVILTTPHNQEASEGVSHE